MNKKYNDCYNKPPLKMPNRRLGNELHTLTTHGKYDNTKSL